MEGHRRGSVLHGAAPPRRCQWLEFGAHRLHELSDALGAFQQQAVQSGGRTRTSSFFTMDEMVVSLVTITQPTAEQTCYYCNQCSGMGGWGPKHTPASLQHQMETTCPTLKGYDCRRCTVHVFLVRDKPTMLGGVFSLIGRKRGFHPDP